jgi:hypothetical protein
MAARVGGCCVMISLYRIVKLALYSRPYNAEQGGEMPIAADKFRAMAARTRKRANETTEPGLRDAYRRLTFQYTGLAVQREAVERCHTPIGRFDAEKSAAESDPSVRSGLPMHSMIGRTMNKAAFCSYLAVLGLSVRSFAAMTGVHYETARHWGGTRSGNPQGYPRWVPLMLEMMDPTVSWKPPADAVNRPRPRSDDTKARSRLAIIGLTKM